MGLTAGVGWLFGTDASLPQMALDNGHTASLQVPQDNPGRSAFENHVTANNVRTNDLGPGGMSGAPFSANSEARILLSDPAWYGAGPIREVVTVFAERDVMIAAATSAFPLRA